MNSSELVTILAEAHGITKGQAQAILDSILKNIVSQAASDGEVSLPGFGKFKVKASPEREVKGFGRRPVADGRAGSGVGVRKPPKEETAGR